MLHGRAVAADHQGVMGRPAQGSESEGLASRLACELADWLGDRPFDRSRLAPIAAIIVAAGPLASASAHLAAAKMGVWGFAIDECFDASGQTRPQLERLNARLEAILDGAVPPEDLDGQGPVGLACQALADIRATLCGSPLWDQLGTCWSTSVRLTLEAMLHEEAWSREGVALPSYAAYIANGEHSVALEPICWTAFIAEGLPLSPQELQAMPASLRIACRGTRLANDLRSAVREHLEGSVNALVVLQQGQALEEAQAVAFVRAELAHDLSALEALPAGPAASPMAGFATRVALLTIRLYAQRDFAEGPPS